MSLNDNRAARVLNGHVDRLHVANSMLRQQTGEAVITDLGTRGKVLEAFKFTHHLGTEMF